MKYAARAMIAVGIWAAPVLANPLEFDPGLGWVTISGGVGTGRAAYFTADETFSVEGAGFFCNMDAGQYEIIIYQGAGEFAAPGAILNTALVTLGGIGLDWQDGAFEFTFQAGQDYILHFRSATVGAAVATQYQRFFWGDGPGEDKDLGIVTIRDGREGYDALNFTNVAFPRLRLLVEKSCYPDCNGVGGLTIADFGCFQTRFVAGDPYADCNGVGGLTIADFACFQTAFVAGCP
jgi:hypothetical protein